MKKQGLRTKAVLLLLTITLVMGALSSCGAERTAVMEYDGNIITANMYSYWLSTYKAECLYYYNSSIDSDEFWDSEVGEDLTAEQWAVNLIHDRIQYTLVGMKLFRDYGLKISADTTAAINADIEEKISYYGSRAELNTALSAFGINIDILKEIYIAEEKLYAVYDYLYGENGVERVSEAEIDAYYQENYSRVKYVIIYTASKQMYDEKGDPVYDSDGYLVAEPLTEEEIAEKRDKINEVLISCNAGESFDDIVAQYSEVDMSSYPNGYYVSPNELNIYGFEMISGIQDMKVGEIRLIEDEYAAYIVQKCDLLDRNEFTSADETQMTGLESYCIQEKYESKFAPMAEEIIVMEDELAGFSIRTAAVNSIF